MSNKCLYCADSNIGEHFCCSICGDGMCDDCYNSEKEHSLHYQEIIDSCEDEDQAAFIIKSCGGNEPDYICQKCLDKILSIESIEIKKHSAWKILERRRYICDDKTMWSSSWDLCNGSIIVASYGKLKYVSKEFELISNNETSDDVSNFLIEALIEKIKTTSCAQFSYQGCFYDIFDSVEGGYIYNVYPDDLDLIFDENGDLKNEEELDGGLCDGDERDVLTYIFPEHLLSTASKVS
ncbi:hypothetical protein [Aliarcobacter butzleri]|uniref:hypothetical protein n=1 Tax=Aliarcobacter butzleri TaxID=28197 RepID=UPI0021B1F787|nr:hypothetical protein [Aliarcobacter butzleri]MCT7578750.1 hypothetical protein [Aliarcobacter butzleri]MCT7648919.1 hypothetical protein [Aliarcobacter butzleri]